MSIDFDVAKLRVDTGLHLAAGFKRLMTSCPVRKPSKEWFIRTHPSPDYQIHTTVIELKEEGKTYLVNPELAENLSHETTFGYRTLVLSINRQGTVFLWPLRLVAADGERGHWAGSALDAAAEAAKSWVRLQANMSLEAYEITVAKARVPDPEWPLMPFGEILRVAFRDRYIDSMDHPILRQLRGEE